MAATAEKSSSKWLVLAILAISVFMLQLDSTIVNIAIPSIMKAFQASISDVEWVLNAYILTFAVLLIALGRLGDLWGRKLFFMAGLVLFTLGSALCGFAPDEHFLIASRVAQGFGGALMMPQTLSLLSVTFPPRQRGMVMGIWGAVVGIATAVGPTLGGVLVEASSWRLIFFINLPIGVIAIAAAWFAVRESKDETASSYVDWAGVLVISVAMFALTFALIEGQKYGWSSATIIGLFGLTVVLLFVFYYVERAVPQPLVDFSLFRSRTFIAGNFSGVALMFGLLGVIFLLTLFLQIVLGFGAVETGLIMTPTPGVVMIVAPFAGRLSDKYGSRWFVFSGLAVAAIGIFLLSHISLSTTWQDLVVPMVVTGIGMGLTMAPVTSAVMGSAPNSKAGNASGILATGRQVGAVLGIAVLGAVLQNRLVSNLLSAIQGLPVPPALKQQMQDQITSGGLSMTGGFPQAGGAIPPQAQQMFQQQLVSAMNTTFFVGVVMVMAGALAALLISSHVEAVRAESAEMQPTDIEVA